MMRRRKVTASAEGDMTVVGWAEQHAATCDCKAKVAEHVTAMIGLAVLAGVPQEVFTVQKGPDGRHSVMFVSRSFQAWEAFHARSSLAALLAMSGLEEL